MASAAPEFRPSRTWILQANPKFYDIDKVPPEGALVYWRCPKYADQIKSGDQALIWKSGPESGLVGWGVFRTSPAHYDLSEDKDPRWKGKESDRPSSELYAPVQVWLGKYIPKAQVASLLPEHQIITAPMGTVFPLNGDEMARVESLLATHGYDLKRTPTNTFTPWDIVPDAKPEQKARGNDIGAKVTSAVFLIALAPERPVEITFEDASLRMVLCERPNVNSLQSLEEQWDKVGVYLLLGNPMSVGATLSAYVGKTLDLQSRVKRPDHHLKDWTRCLLVRRDSSQAFNASDISWLERRLYDVLFEAPAVDLVNRTPPPEEKVPMWREDILERTVTAMIGVLGVLGAYIT